MRLDGYRVLVSGAASGIGLAVCQRFVAEGASVALVDVAQEALDAAADGLEGRASPGAVVTRYVADVSDELAATEAVARAARDMEGLDGVVNCAGIDLTGGVEATTVADWDRLFAVNLRGPFLLCRAALPHLRHSSRPSIVNVASGAGLLPVANRSAYCASKAGLVMFSKALALEAAPVRVNAVCPGAIDTPLLRTSYEGAEDPASALQAIRDRYALREIGDASDVANAALYLISSESSFVTGTALAVDGGRTFH